MTNITPILAQEAGIQYQGVEDRSSKTGTYPVIGLITGSFKRGRYDKPMTISLDNIKAQLGHEPNNPHYIAVLDTLMSGVPSVQVVRVKSGGGGAISCAGATNDVYAVMYMDTQAPEQDMVNVFSKIKMQFNGRTFLGEDPAMLNYVQFENVSLTAIPAGLTVPPAPKPDMQVFAITRFSNVLANDLRMTLDATENNENLLIAVIFFGNNPAIMPGENPRIAQACLSEKTAAISCDGASQFISLPMSPGGQYKFIINGQVVFEGLARSFVEADISPYSLYSYADEDTGFSLRNNDPENSLRMRIEALDANPFSDDVFNGYEMEFANLLGLNSAEREDSEYPQWIEFCLGRYEAT
ncbi:hypothetical protein F965_00122 [Acinetobacter schindleri NIPH 900]|uniref:Uncharacterized protein n=1 Tax=Acinetobacter schindleri NIPH 900 TaxID=1217675 RepID=N8WS06_9GAMM|nr:hypothetical protein [Acinetobacter schindleri]ENV14776.1 hypothetical protein F965_00122 [Acinetobacter schindleri NIPH 900]